MELSDYGDLFLSESREHLSAINHLLLALEADPRDRGPVEGVFRGVHTIKGMAATMGYGEVAELAHELEELLERVRRGERGVDAELADLLFEGADAVEQAIGRAVVDAPEPDGHAPLIARLRAATAAGNGAAIPARAAPDGTLAVEVAIRAHSPLPGVRAFLVLRRAREMGEVSGVEPSEAALGADGFAGTLRFRLASPMGGDAVREALVAVGEVERVTVVEPRPAEPVPTEAEVAPEARVGRNVRVDVRRLDALMNAVGELVIVRDQLQRLRPPGDAALAEALDHAGRLVGELQTEIVGARLVPVWQVFERFPRLVRDAARTLDKRVELVVEGREIEFDRSVLDEIGDPLVHLLRNAIDHGIETAAERRAAGKPETGTIRLSASRERSRVVVRVGDDGRGVDRAAVRVKAVAAGLIDAQAAAALGDEETLRLLLHPGLSTAATVTDVSGRGVGLDVVATRVRALGGTLDIESEPGRGTAFTLHLPLSLAIVRALLVRTAGEAYALPLTHVAEAVELGRSELATVRGRRVATLRDEVIPLIHLGTLLRSPGEPGASDEDRCTVVVVEAGERIVGVQVDALIGQQEIVVKSFDSTVCTLRYFSGATILADGRPALILDAGSLIPDGAGGDSAFAR